MEDLDPTQFAEAHRREVNPPIEVASATWTAVGSLGDSATKAFSGPADVAVEQLARILQVRS